MSFLRGFLRGDDLDLTLRDGGVEVRRIGALVLVGTTASILFHLAISVFTDARWPQTTFLYKPNARFFDFLEVYGNARTFGNYGVYTITYSGVLHLLTIGLSYLPSVLAWLAVVAMFLVVLVLVVWFGVTARVGGRVARDVYTLVLCALAYPVLLTLDRSNLEMVVFVLLAAFVYLYYVRDSRWAWLPLAFAIAGKYYWVVLLVLLLSDRRWRQLLAASLGAVFITLTSAVALGAISGLGFVGVLRSTLSTLGAHTDGATSANAVQHAHQLFSVLYFIDRSTGYWLQVHGSLSQMYLIIAGCAFALVVARVLLYELEQWRKLAALIICALVLPFENHDYTLIQLFLPLALMGAWGAHTKRGWLYVIAFGLLLIPLDYVQFGFGVSYSSLIYALVLLVLLGGLLTDGARPRRVPFWKAVPESGEAEV